MKKILNNFLCITLVLVLFISYFFVSDFSITSNAVTFDDINRSSVFLHQPADGDSTCVFTSCLNMFRRRAIIDGISGWENITHTNYSKKITTNGVSVRATITDVLGMNASRTNNLTNNKKSYFISMLNEHPEGIVIYCGSNPMHTVLLTDYEAATDTFYCAETLSRYSYGRIPLTSCYINNGGLSQDAVISKISYIWYISNKSGGNVSNFTQAPSNVWISLPNGAESSYLPNTDVKISFGANWAEYYYLNIFRTYNGITENYWEGSFNQLSDDSSYCAATFDKLGHYSAYVTAFNSVGSAQSEWIGWDIVDDVPSNVWVSLPKGPESTYKLNETFHINFGADWADTYCVHMWREYEGSSNFYFEEKFRKSSDGNNYCSVVFDKTGHYSCVIIATNAVGESCSEWIGWDIVDDVPDSLSISTDKTYYKTDETVEFELYAENDDYKHIGIHKFEGTDTYLYYQSSVEGTSISVSSFIPGKYRANFDAINPYGTTRSDWVYFYVCDKVTHCNDKVIEDRFLKKSATCNSKAEYYLSCDVCGEKGTDIFEAGDFLQHTYKGIVTAPTCTAEGYTTFTCEKCGDTYKGENVSATGHSFGGWKVTAEATCTKAGLKEKVCACGEKETEEIPATKHNYNSVITAPTCTTEGYTTFTCEKCGDTYKGDKVSATGHSFGGWKVTAEATCTKAGLKEKVCACGEKETEEVPAKGHSFGKWGVKYTATCQDEGLEERVCSCGETETKTIAKTSHSDSDNDGYCDECYEKTGNASTGNNNCSHLCHSKNAFIAKLIWPIVRFFIKLFGTNPVCTCGASHY